MILLGDYCLFDDVMVMSGDNRSSTRPSLFLCKDELSYQNTFVVRETAGCIYAIQRDNISFMSRIHSTHLARHRTLSRAQNVSHNPRRVSCCSSPPNAVSRRRQRRRVSAISSLVPHHRRLAPPRYQAKPHPAADEKQHHEQAPARADLDVHVL